LLSWRDTLSAIENLHEVAESRGVACAITLQTNLTFLPQGFIAAVKQHRIFVLANIDGDRGVHDAARPHKVSRRSSYDETSRCLAELRSNHVQFGLRCTVTRHNAGMLSEIAQLHEDLGAAVSVFKMLVPVAYNGQSMEHLLPDIDVYREGLRRFMSTRDWTDQAWCREFINTIEAVRGGSAPQSANCSAANANSYTIDQSGHIYNCPNLIGNAHFDTGPLSGLDHGRRTEIGGLLARQRDPVCGRCSYRFVCTSACLLPKVLGVGDAQALMSRARELQCATTKPIVDDLIRRMSHQVLDGRAPILPEHRLGVADLAPEWRSWLLSVVGSPAETVEAQLVSSGYFSASQAHALVIEAMQLEPSVRA
jgi:radical SAM protein with 4Fe4S-binding SPASM domain